MGQAITNERGVFLPEGNDLRVLFTNNQVDITDSRAQNDSIYSLNNNSESAKRLRATCHHNTGDTAGTSDGPKSEDKNSNAARTSMLNETFNQISAFDITIDESLKGITFNSNRVQYNDGNGFNYNLQAGEQNILQVEDNNGNMVDATLDQLIQLQDQSMQSTGAVSPEIQAIQDYMSGETNEIPPLLQQMADERGIENPTRANFDELLKEKFAENHMDIYYTTTFGYDPDIANEKSNVASCPNCIASSNVDAAIETGQNLSGSFDSAVQQSVVKSTVEPASPATTLVQKDPNLATPGLGA